MDLNQLAKRIVDEATGEIEPEPEIDKKKKAAIESGRLGGIKGGKARTEKLTPEERSEIAKKQLIKDSQISKN
ncbi:MAG: histone H1 [Proteobacteria bacterium]|nr:histone H1 [Pseudomonadota bacterium]